ncbi:hypothetical protein M758_11G073700 [Ceratodon purpureus]|nr:hypothetical protein M758_11G073700 [Ceratodon purpureus]
MGNIMSCIPWSRGVSICSPDVSIRSPDVSICSPDVPICSTDVPICSPDVPICSPDVSIRSPDVSIRSPDVSIPKPIHWSDLSEIDGDGFNDTEELLRRISSSLCHWSESDRDDSDTEAVTADNREVFKELQMHPQWGTFFKTFSEDDLVLGSKFAEGAQAELFDVQVDWRNPADRGKRSIIEERIERSKDHWTQLAQPNSSGSNSEEAAAVEVSNRKVFEDLQKQSTFFYKFEKGEMVLGKKFAEGAQGEIYSAQIEWRNSDWRKLLLREGEGGDVLKDPSEYVIKAFKKEYQLEDLKNLFPKAMLEFHAQRVRVWMERRYTCDVVCGTLLEDGRFAFVLQREHADLRALIDRNMDSRKEVVQTLLENEAVNQLFLKRILLGCSLDSDKLIHIAGRDIS